MLKLADATLNESFIGSSRTDWSGLDCVRCAMKNGRPALLLLLVGTSIASAEESAPPEPSLSEDSDAIQGFRALARAFLEDDESPNGLNAVLHTEKADGSLITTSRRCSSSQTRTSRSTDIPTRPLPPLRRDAGSAAFNSSKAVTLSAGRSVPPALAAWR